MLRMRFQKDGNGIWISHLDLMKVMQRAFRRADLQIRHTHGFNPHAFVSIALPLPVGTSSQCELLEFELDSPVSLNELPLRLNAVLPDGIRCLEVWEGGKKLRELVWLRTKTVLEYDGGIPEGLLPALTALFSRETLPVEKKSKGGMKEIDVKPMLHSLEPRLLDENRAELEAVVRAQDPPLNPELLVKAIARYAEAFSPDFSKSERLEIYDAGFKIFR